jgi:hypothetical protein
LLSELQADRGFDRANCLGTFAGQADDDRSAPSNQDGYYYLTKSLGPACASRGYGDAHGVTPDPRDLLESLDPCP